MIRITLFLSLLFFAVPVAMAADRCVDAPVLMYHHVIDIKLGRAKGYGSLFVDPQMFRRQMRELRELGYEIRPLDDLSKFFDTGAKLPEKTAFITFDDGNKNIVEQAMPILKEFGYPSTMFVIPRQMTHPLYASIDDVKRLSTQNVMIANHSFSHPLLSRQTLRQTREQVLRADHVLAQNGLNKSKVFAFPYGVDTAQAILVLKDLKYSLAFKANGGIKLCSSNRMRLPRVSISNSSLVKQGFR